MTAVPLVDLTPWYAGGPAGRRQVATDVDRALCEAGFLLVTGHRVGTGVADRLCREVRQFFALPPARRARLACFSGGRGWVPPGVPAAVDPDGRGTPPDLRESFAFGAERVPVAVAGTAEEEWYGPNSWPVEVPGLRPAASAFAAACSALAQDLLRVAALALDLADDFFVARCSGETWTVDLERCPARQEVGTVAPGQLRVGPHTDVGTLTVSDRRPLTDGLQVRALDGGWVDVPSAPGALTVNAGDLLARWTGDRWRSTPHRVLPPPVEDPTEELLELAFSAEADPWTVVERLPTAAAGPTRYEPVTAGRFRRSRTDSMTVG
ncbi:isopenicillin N synthase family dioxygenase [Modestobacter altitudinis]|uniref:isopenicillin N synthase family dioxygenase n=1 Tax=Modestobacter altitudinis TaxID=2213158 RepID=UPI00110CA3A1|nr:2-oxoglutarate and iron-dependent oxygenase domain-containing protein [Modestobacter altitudinis]